MPSTMLYSPHHPPIMSTSAQSTKPATVESAVEPKFWATYETVANEYDDKWLSRVNDDMGIILTFAGLLSAVNSTFLIGLQPNPVDTTNILVIRMLNIMVNGPDAVNISPLSSSTYSPTFTLSQELSHCSLAYSILAAFVVLISKQWLDFSKVTRRRESLEEYGMRRQEKLNQRVVWQLKIFRGIPYTFLQISILFFGVSICLNLWAQQAIVSFIAVVCTTGLCLLFCATIIIANFFRLETSAKPDVVEAVVTMVPLMQWPSGHNASAIYTYLRDAFTTYRWNQELFVKCGKAMAHLCLQPAKIDRTLLRQEWETWDASEGMNPFIRDAFMAGRSAWEKLRMAKRHDNRLKLKADVRTALRTMVVHGQRSHLSYPDDEKLIWDADLQWRYESGHIPCREEFDWLVDYLMDEIDHDKTDAETQHDALLALSAMHGLGSDAKRSSYIKALIHCMDRCGPKEVRYAAIRAVSDAREELSTGNSMPRGVDAKLLDEFSCALLAVVRPNDVPDGRDPIPLPKIRCYLRLIFALAKNDEWRKRLGTDPDLKQWFTEDASVGESNFSELDFYRVGIYLLTYPDSMGHSLVDAQEGWGALTRRAWNGLSIISINQDFGDCLEILPALVTETKRNLPASLPTEDLRRLFGGVDQVLQTLKEDKSLDHAILDSLLSFHNQLNGILGDRST